MHSPMKRPQIVARSSLRCHFFTGPHCGFLSVFEAAGAQATLDDAAKVARIGGQILQVGMPKTPPTVDMTMVIFHEITRTPIRVYRDEDVAQAIAIAATGKLDLTTPVTHVLPLGELAEGMEIAHAATDACKILLTPNL